MEKVTHHAGTSARIMKVMGLFSGVQGLNIICSVVRTKMVAIWIGSAGVGLFSIYNSAIDMVISLALLGIGVSAVRDISSHENLSRRLLVTAVVRRWGIILGIAGGLIMMTCSRQFSVNSFGDTAHWPAFAILGVCVLMNAIASTNNAVMQGFRAYRALAKASLWGSITGLLISAPMFYWLGIDSIIPALVAFSAAAMVSVLASRPSIERPTERITARIMWTIGRGFIILGIYMTLSSFSTFGVNYLFVSWLSRATSVEEVGLFQAAFTLFNRYAGIIFTSISVEYYPRLANVAWSRTRTEVFVNHEATIVLWLLAAFISLFILFAAVIVKILYAPSFLEIVPLVTIGIIGTVFKGLSWCIAMTVIARGDGRVYLISELTSAALYLALNIVFYKAWGLTGLGVSYIVWYAAYCLIVWAIYRLRYGMRLSRNVITLTVAVTIVSSLMAVIALISPYPWLNTIPTLAMVAVACRNLYSLFRHR